METLPIRNRRLLVVEELQVERDRLCAALAGDYEVDAVASGEDAPARIRAALDVDQPYAVAFLGMSLVSGRCSLPGLLWQLDPRLQLVICSHPAEFLCWPRWRRRSACCCSARRRKARKCARWPATSAPSGAWRPTCSRR